jgi:hypothetical protein
MAYLYFTVKVLDGEQHFLFLPHHCKDFKNAEEMQSEVKSQFGMPAS